MNFISLEMSDERIISLKINTSESTARKILTILRENGQDIPDFDDYTRSMDLTSEVSFLGKPVGWTKIPFTKDLEVLYSDQPQIRSIKSKKPIVLFTGRDGYLCLHYNLKNGSRVTESLHLFLAKLFIKNNDPLHKTMVDHMDRNKYNNNLSNLRWATPRENAFNKTIQNALYFTQSEIDEIGDVKKVYSYDGSEFDFLYYSKKSKSFFIKPGEESRLEYRLVYLDSQGCYQLTDNKGKNKKFSANKFYDDYVNGLVRTTLRGRPKGINIQAITPQQSDSDFEDQTHLLLPDSPHSP